MRVTGDQWNVRESPILLWSLLDLLVLSQLYLDQNISSQSVMMGSLNTRLAGGYVMEMLLDQRPSVNQQRRF